MRHVYGMELAKEPRINSNLGMKLQKLHIIFWGWTMTFNPHIHYLFIYLFIFGVMGNLPIHVIWGQGLIILSPQPLHLCTPNLCTHMKSSCTPFSLFLPKQIWEFEIWKNNFIITASMWTNYKLIHIHPYIISISKNNYICWWEFGIEGFWLSISLERSWQELVMKYEIYLQVKTFY
jgi:hypothetical protein